MWMIKKAAVLSAFCVSSALLCSTAYASPNFSHSTEEWAALNDNNLNWSEIDDLVHEFNADVLKNRNAGSKDERKGMDAEEIRDYALHMAERYDDLADSLSETSALQSATMKSSANSLRQQADNEIVDMQIIAREYELAEKQIALTAKKLFLGYYGAVSAKEYGEKNLAQLERNLQSVINQKNVGMATELQVLSAQETLQNAQAQSVITASSVGENKKKLGVLCGWQYESDPVIGELPAFEPSQIDAVNYAGDKEKAMAACYALKIDQMKLDNANKYSAYDNLISQYEKQLADDKVSKELAFKSLYDNMVSAKTDYTNALSAEELSRSNMELSERQFGNGVISRVQRDSAVNTYEQAQGASYSARLKMISAYCDYQAAIEGVF